jgi:transcriptional regulator with XRE-family HTH domain
MEHDQGPPAPTRAVAQRVREVRERRRMTAARLAEEMTRVGVPWDRGTVAKLETGRRENVSVVELLALAAVLDVAPVHLLVPPDHVEQPYQVTPTITEDADMVRAWIRGFLGLVDTDRRLFLAEMPEAEVELYARRELGWDARRRPIQGGK